MFISFIDLETEEDECLLKITIYRIFMAQIVDK